MGSVGGRSCSLDLTGARHRLATPLPLFPATFAQDWLAAFVALTSPDSAFPPESRSCSSIASLYHFVQGDKGEWLQHLAASAGPAPALSPKGSTNRHSNATRSATCVAPAPGPAPVLPPTPGAGAGPGTRTATASSATPAATVHGAHAPAVTLSALRGGAAGAPAPAPSPALSSGAATPGMAGPAASGAPAGQGQGGGGGAAAGLLRELSEPMPGTGPLVDDPLARSWSWSEGPVSVDEFVARMFRRSNTFIYGSGRLTDSVAALLSKALHATHTVSRKPLAQQAACMRQPVREWLVQLGRPPAESGMQISLTAPLDALQDDQEFWLGPRAAAGAEASFVLTGSEVKQLADGAVLSYLEPLMPPGSILKAGYAEQDHTATQLLVLCGDIYVTFDSEFRPQRRAPRPVCCCSVPGINFAYSPADATEFMEHGLINRPKALRRMCSIWAHVFLCMQKREV